MAYHAWVNTTAADMPMTAATQKVVNRLHAAGLRPLLVGGCVRDWLLQGQSKDVDIEVYGAHSLDDIAKAVRPLGAVSMVGKAFGVAKVSTGGEDFDLSLPRTEVSTGRKPTDFTTSFEVQDVSVAASRRDLTINAIGFDPVDKVLVDPFNGVEDLRAGVLRHVSEAFAEDPVRVLRLAGFAARFGMIVHQDTVQLCRTMVNSFDAIPTERVWTEFEKMAAKSLQPSKFFDALAATGWLAHFPIFANLQGVPQPVDHHPEGDAWTHSMLAADMATQNAVNESLTRDDRVLLVLAAVLHDCGKPATLTFDNGRPRAIGHESVGAELAYEFLTTVGAPHKLAKQVQVLVKTHMSAFHEPDPKLKTCRKLQRKLASPGVCVPMKLWALLVDADLNGRGLPDKLPNPALVWLQKLEDTTQPPQPLVTGKHLIAAGFTPGPGFSQMLAQLQDWQDAEQFTTVEQGLAMLAEHSNTV